MSNSKRICFLVVFACLIFGVTSIIFECDCIDNICQMVPEASDNCTTTGTNDLTLPAGVTDPELQEVELIVRNLSLESTSNLFQSLAPDMKKIIAIDLSENKLASLHTNEFSSMERVTVLDVSNNQLETLEENAFAGLVELEVLILSSNQLSQIPFDSFAKLPSLHTLILNNNSIQTLAAYPFANCYNLTTLYLEFNDIQTLLPCSHYSGVRELYLKGNQLTDVEHLMNFNSSTKVDLSFNPNLKLTGSSFKEWQSLEHLAIDNIDLKGSEQLVTILRSAEALQEISMSNNRLEALTIADFPQLSNLVSLRINENLLTEFNYEQLTEKFPKIRKIAIAGNRWDCNFLNEMLKDFKQRSITIVDVPSYESPLCEGAHEDEKELEALIWLGLSVAFIFIALILFFIQIIS